MVFSDYLLIALIVFLLLLYPSLRKMVSLLEILVNKYVQRAAAESVSSEVSDATRTVLNLKLLAYERIILFIERMKPDSLIPRTLTAAEKNREYQRLLIQEIRKEFEYNLSQQLYVSENAWTATVNFKDNVITLINSASAECNPEGAAGELARKILERYITSNLQVDQLLKLIKGDIH